MLDVRKNGTSNELVIVLHAFQQSPRSLNSVCRQITEAYPNADIIAPQMPSGLWSSSNPEDIAQWLLLEVDAVYEANDLAYREIQIVGHSLGALIARMLYVLARERQSIEKGFPDWPQKVVRIILFAGMNRGWQLSHHLGPVRMMQWLMGMLAANLFKLVTGRDLLIMAVRRGAPFITKLRVRWIELSNPKFGPMPLTIQLLGSIDDIVAPTDDIDMVAGNHFIYLDIPYSGHQSVIEMDAPALVTSRTHGRVTQGFLKRDVFRAALLDDANALEDRQVFPEDHQRQRPDPNIDHVVFVIHGIRDQGHWTQKIARRIVQRSKEIAPEIEMATETSSYGYFPMLPFFLPGARRKKVAWFMDQYAETKALYPRAKISFVGHSNGTYLLGKALNMYPFCEFENVVLAGSVLRSDYDWDSVKGKQVKSVMNFVASRDWVVAFFPKAIELLRLQDLGSGGHDGFGTIDSNLRYVEGAHSAALVEENWDTIASFVVTGDLPKIPESIKSNGGLWLDLAVRLLARVAWIVWLILAIAAFSFGQIIWQYGAGEAESTLMVVAYIWVLWNLITKI